MMRKNHQQYRNTTYIDGFAVLFFDGMSKERKKYKRTKCNLWRTGKIQKNTKIQIAFLDVMEKYQKNKNTKCIFLYFIRIFLVFFVFLQKKYEKIQKIQKNTNAIAQKYKIQKTYESTISKIQNTKKYEPKISKIQNTKKRQIQK